MWSFNPPQDDELQKWIWWFFLKVLGLFIISNLLPFTAHIPLLFGLLCAILLIIGLFIFKDVKEDPYEILKASFAQFQLWWRTKGPVQLRPYYYHFNILERFFLGFMPVVTRDIQKTVRVNSKLLWSGGRVAVKQKIPNICPNCDGKRVKPLTVLLECKKCSKGIQVVKFRQFFSRMPLPCERCLTTGWVPAEPCSKCHGSGFIWERKILKITIPPQSEGRNLCLEGLGKFDAVTKDRGNLYLHLKRNFVN